MKRLIYFLTIITFISCNSDKISTQLLNKNENLIKSIFQFTVGQHLRNPTRAKTCFYKSEKLMDRYKLLMKSIIDNQINKDSILKFLMYLESSGAITKGFYQQEDFNLKNESLLIYQIQNLTYQGLQYFKYKMNEKQHVTNLTKIISIKKENYIEFYPVSIDTSYLPNIMIGKLKENENEFETSFISADIKGDFNYQIKMKDLNKINLKDKVEGLYVFETFDGEFDTIRFSNKIE